MIILYADDDPEDRELFADALKEVSPETRLVVANHGKEVLQHLKSTSEVPDYIFLDINMPVMGGKDCLINLRAQKPFRDIPVLMYTTDSTKSELSKYLELGAQAYLVKEPSFQGIKQMLRKVLTGNITPPTRHLSCEAPKCTQQLLTSLRR